MTETFKKAFKLVIGHEGGYVNDPSDPGGETKYGIAKRSYPDVDIKNLTLEQAEEIYYRDFWKFKKLDLDRVAEFSPEAAIELFDTGVNMGIVRAAKFLQEALNLMNRNEKLFDDLKVDGWCGNVTFNALNKLKSYDKKPLLKVLNGLQFCHYKEIVEKNPKLERFFVGWMKRVD